MAESNALSESLAREHDRLSVGELIAEFAGDLERHRPPVFGEALDWPALGFEDGPACWRALCAATGERHRERPAITFEAWDHLLRAEMIRRARLYSAIEGDPVAEAAHRMVCKDPLRWIHDCGWIRDPHKRGKERVLANSPLILFPFQMATVLWLESLNDAFGGQVVASICKSRSVGITWLLMHLHLHKAVFQPGFTGLLGSIRGNLADNRQFTSLMGKADYLRDRQPAWILAGTDMGRRRRQYEFKVIRNGVASVLFGQTMNANFGRGERVEQVVLDERAAVDVKKQNAVTMALESVSSSVVSISTPRGRGNDFYSTYINSHRRLSLALPWPVDVRRCAKWKAEKLLGGAGWLTEAEFEREYNCSFDSVTGSKVFPRSAGIGFVESDPAWVALNNKARRSFEIIGGADFGEGRSALVITFALIDRSVSLPTAYGPIPRLWWDAEVFALDATSDGIADALRTRWKSWFPSRDLTKVKIWGDPTANYRQIDGLTWYQELRNRGIPIVLADKKSNSPHERGLQLALADEMMARGFWRVHVDRASASLRAAQEWEWDIPEGVPVELVNSAVIKPRKDQWSHFGDAQRYALDSMMRTSQLSPDTRRAMLAAIKK